MVLYLYLYFLRRIPTSQLTILQYLKWYKTFKLLFTRIWRLIVRSLAHLPKSKYKICVFETSIDLSGSGVDFVKFVHVWRICGYYLTTSNVRRIGPPWRATCTIASTVRCWPSHVVTCNLKMVRFILSFEKTWNWLWCRMKCQTLISKAS